MSKTIYNIEKRNPAGIVDSGKQAGENRKPAGDKAPAAPRRWVAVMAFAWLAVLSVFPASVIRFPRDRAASVAVVVRNLSTGEDIVSQNPVKAMLPASTMKCFTTAAAMEAGLDSAFIDTRVCLRGSVENGVLNGSLVIIGSGDPTTDSAQFPSAPGFVGEIADAVKRSGITYIRGGIVIDESDFPDSGPNQRWELSDTKYEYGAGLYGVNYRDNRRGDRAMPDPGEELGEALERALLSRGISMGWDNVDDQGAGLVEICRHRSPRCDEIMENLMRRSDNLFAEAMLRRLAPGQSLSEAIARERKLLEDKGVELDVTDIYDGSGLSRNNRTTALTMANLLSRMADKQGSRMSYVDLFPKVGRDGTVKNLLKGTSLEGKLALKSGSMNGVHCYAGYKLDKSGTPTHAVVILINDFFCRRADVRNSIASFLKSTFPE